ncbi:hypothetical protein EXIGLDRAFT_724554 [Exidia glandulosa HHB12029]|uniref:Fe2OG dioxygenase domain-containing protein n=1 Tax=Exidia glandulosa HHB12029 TaxID=1314781 RepID=A0A165ECR9_EXIGL|nr:hypothetical protein EXIGLDRAFT_724554 [Exidia glandulosa HHB12029]
MDAYFVYADIANHLRSAAYRWDIDEKDQVATTLSFMFEKLQCRETAACLNGDLASVPLMLTAEETSCGTIGDTDVEALRALVAPSSFGRGEETVYDEDVRKGLEIRAAQMHFDLDHAVKEGSTVRDVFQSIAAQLQLSLFPAQPVKLVFYKLALYEAGGHFSAHRDSTHDDSHHGTLLIGCKARGEDPYQGGDFLVTTSNGEMPFRIDEKGWVAFYTDCEHTVKPVTSGTRMSLQFDVYLESDAVARPHTVSCVPARDVKEIDYDDEGESKAALEDSDDEVISLGNFSEPISDGADRRVMPFLLRSFVDKLVEVLRVSAQFIIPRDDEGRARKKRVRTSNHPQTIILPLRHLYRGRALVSQYLKGIDKLLVDMLEHSEDVSVSMHAVIRSKVRCDEDPAMNSESLGLASPDVTLYKTIKEPVTIVRRPTYDRKFIRSKPFIEHTGNEPQLGETQYLMGAMFISLKNRIVSTRTNAVEGETLSTASLEVETAGHIKEKVADAEEDLIPGEEGEDPKD